MTLLELAERCERASGPDRELDALIVTTLCPGATVSEYIEGYGDDIVFHAAALGIRDKDYCPSFTASLDAAMTLVPEGCGWLAGWGQTRPDEPMGGARITRNAKFCGYDANYDAIVDAEAATPALALTVAALRAHAKEASDAE